ncbi:MAG: T9SS type A sorting domain-containing protein [Flavobacteriaceae bacterium]|nr:T9SS type A sorting domain-containing protein [Flavobacteriaceae bacterium]
MRRLLLILALFTGLSTFGQFNQQAPWMEEFRGRSADSPIKFKDVVDAFNSYWETRDPDVRGSGFKPFKRWEAYWQHYVDESGYLPTSTDLWNAWIEKEAQANSRNTLADESNWLSIGPTDFANRPFSTANIGRVNVIIKDPNNANTLYAGAPAGGIWKSTDAGLSWDQLADDLPQIGVSGIAIDYNDSNTIYIATGDDDAGDSYSVGVFKSTDGGATWNQTGLNPLNSPTDMNDIYIDPNDSNKLWVATNNGVYRTTNAGVSWTNTIGSANIKDIKIKPGDTNTIYAVTSSAFFRSTDGGVSFTAAGTGLPGLSGRLVIDVTPANPNVVYAVSATTSWGFQGVFKSTDGGSTFTQSANAVNIFESTQAWYDLALAVSQINENEIYVGVLNIWKSINGGNSFSQVNSWFQHTASFTHADIHFLRFYDNELYAGTDGGFYKSSNGGTTFTDLTEGMEISQFYRIDVSEQTSTKIAGGTQDNGGFGYSSGWNNYHGGDGMEGVIDPNNDNLFYGFMQFGQNLFVSTDSGQSGSQAFSGPANGNWITPLAVNSESEVYAGYNFLYRFNGSGFDQVSGFIGGNIDVLEIDPIEPDNMYVAIDNSLHKSLNRGVNFSNVESFPSNITSIEVNNNDSDVVYVTTSGLNGGVYRSSDGGFTFNNITGSLPSVVKLIIKHRADDPLNNLYLGTSIGVYRYDDNLGDWEVFDNNLPNVAVRDLAINVTDEIIVAGTFGRGIWTSPLQTTQLAQDDVKLIAVNSPAANNFACGEVTPQIEVKNNGQNTITQIDITYTVDGGPDSNYTWNGSLASEATTLIDLPALTLGIGEHDLDVSVSVTNDTFPTNNNAGKSFFVNDTGIAQLVNTFETPEEELITFNEVGGAALFERGVPAGALLNTAVSGTQVYGTNLDGDHTNMTKAYLFSQCYDLNQIVNPVLKFHMAFEIEFDWDLAYVEYTIDGGLNWSLLGSESDPNWYNSSRFAGDGIANNCYNCVGGQWTGTNATMTEYSYDLTALNNESEVIFRIVYHSDQAVVEEGIIVDDFFVDGTLSTSEFTLGSVMIYPNPSDNIFNIKISNIGSYNYTVTDLTGKVVMKVRDIDRINHQLDMSNYSAGLYLLNIETEGRRLTRKLILK